MAKRDWIGTLMFIAENIFTNSKYDIKGNGDFIEMNCGSYDILLVPLLLWEELNPASEFNKENKSIRDYINYSRNRYNRWILLYKNIKQYIDSDRNYICLFFTHGKFDIKDTKYKLFSRNPEFLNIAQPIFKCEYIEIGDVSNVIDISTLLKGINKIKSNIEKVISCYSELMDKLSVNSLNMLQLKKSYYKSFVEPYISIINDIHRYTLSIELLEDIFAKSQGYQKDNHRHKVELDFLRTPIPFFMKDLINKLLYIREKCKNPCKIYWIDNNPSKDAEKALSSIIKYIFNSKNKNEKLVKTYNLNFESIDSELPNNLNKFHFIFLDFFLDEMDTWTANKFIEEFLENNINSVSRYWVFISSRYRHAVTKYFESGYLSNIYPHFHIIFGDFWHGYYDSNSENKGENIEGINIIFLYKLIQLIHSRISYYDYLKDTVDKLISGELNSLDTRDLLVTLRLLLRELNSIGNVIEGNSVNEVKDFYESLYNLVLYTEVLSDIEIEVLAEMKRRIENDFKSRGVIIKYKPLIDKLKGMFKDEHS